MKEEYIKNIETHKEVLNALPKNNEKNLKTYKTKVSELKETYEKDLTEIIEEISKRNKQYLSIKPYEQSIQITEQLKQIKPNLIIINDNNSPYEKSNLDIILYKLCHYYTIELEEVNNNIMKAIAIFKQANINLEISDFTYSYYSYIYMNKLLSTDISNKSYLEEFKTFFENIYWKCPNIIYHIALNFKYLYYQYQKKFNEYYDKVKNSLVENKIKEMYQNLLKDSEELIENSKYNIISNFINNKYNITDYTSDKVNKIKENLYDNEEMPLTDIINLSHILYEYRAYLSLNYLIIDIKNIYNEKDKYKDIYLKTKKEIIKKEKSLFKENKKIQKLISKNKIKKLNYYNNLINSQIIELTKLYEELEKNYFKEKVSKLNESSTILDILELSLSNYNYLIELTKEKDMVIEEELLKISNITYYPYINLINNIWIKDEKDIPLIIIDKYNLIGFKLTKEMLEEDNINTLINNINIIILAELMKKNNITENQIKFIKESNSILKSIK